MTKSPHKPYGRSNLKPEMMAKGRKRPDNSGRAPGTPNKTTRILKEAILMAAEQTGDHGGKGKAKGADGLVGYLRWVARTEPKSFVVLLGKVLPLQIMGLGAGDRPAKINSANMTVQQAAELYAATMQQLRLPQEQRAALSYQRPAGNA